MIFIIEKIRNITLCLFHAKSALAAVSGDITAAALEQVYRQDTMVDTSAAAAHGGRIDQIYDFIQRKHGSRLWMVQIPLSCDQSGAESTHNAGNIRTDGVTVCDLFKTS